VPTIAFVGQGVYFRQCALEGPAGDLEPVFLDFRAGARPEPLLARLEQIDPDVVLVFRPEIIPARLFDGLRAVTIGYLTEPLPRSGKREHADLDERMWWLEQVDAASFDRVISFDPLIADTAARVLPVWRSLPLPVADSLYMDEGETACPPRLLFVGRSTEHREQMLSRVKPRFPIVHIGHGLFGEQLRDFLAGADVQLNLHNHPYPTFENRVCIALAAAHLVISEPLSPDHGLQAGTEYLEVTTPDELLAAVERVVGEPGDFTAIRSAGRAAAERFRASSVYPALVRDALEDVAASGTARRR
jgi:hypothetical protein